MATDDQFPSDFADRFQVRMPPGLRDRLKSQAEANKRSMNAEIVARLEESLSRSAVALPPDAASLADQIVQRVMEKVNTMRQEMEAFRRDMDEKVETLEAENKVLSDIAKSIERGLGSEVSSPSPGS